MNNRQPLINISLLNMITENDFVPTLLFSLLTLKEFGRLASVSRFSHGFFQPILAAKVIQHVIFGKEKLVSIALSAHPALLLQKVALVFDHADLPMKEITIFQAALRLQDTKMWEMIEPFFDKLPNGPMEKAKQFSAEYPNGVLIEQTAFDFSKIVSTIQNEPNDSDWRDVVAKLAPVLKQFREEFKQQVLTEKHFNPQHMIQAAITLNEQFPKKDAPHNRSNWKHLLFYQKVFSYVKCYMPICYHQEIQHYGALKMDRKKMIYPNSLRSFDQERQSLYSSKTDGFSFYNLYGFDAANLTACVILKQDSLKLLNERCALPALRTAASSADPIEKLRYTLC